MPIFVFGFPHSGTSILKNILSHVPFVISLGFQERKSFPHRDQGATHSLIKWPWTEARFLHDPPNCKKVFILRNPLWVFSSLNRRFENKIPENHSIDKYIATVRLFLQWRKNAPKDMYFIRYEDMFEDNYRFLRDILDGMGLEYTDSIFDNHLYLNDVHAKTDVPSEVPNCTGVSHNKFRIYQVNQAFINNNDLGKVCLFPKQVERLLHDPDILQLYPDIKETFASTQKPI